MSTLSTGLMNQMGDAFENAGFSAEDVTKLRSRIDLLRQVKEVLEGRMQITAIKYLVDLDAAPFTPNGWEVVEHKKGGQFEFDPAKVHLHLSPNQQGGKVIGGHDLRQELANEPVFNANFLDFYLVHPELITESWKGKYIPFWGTIYRGSDGDLFVRYLYWYDGLWYWGCGWLGSDFDGHDPAALRASKALGA